MDDTQIIARIDELVTEEHQLRARAEGDHPLSDRERSRLSELEVRLDQAWDLLRQRRAQRRAGHDPDDASERDPSVVENYRQ
jgi:hypothetical protein